MKKVKKWVASIVSKLVLAGLVVSNVFGAYYGDNTELEKNVWDVIGWAAIILAPVIIAVGCISGGMMMSGGRSEEGVKRIKMSVLGGVIVLVSGFLAKKIPGFFNV